MSAVRAKSYMEIYHFAILKQQWSCYEQRDWDCLQLSSLLAAEDAASYWSALVDAEALDDVTTERAKQFLEWQSELPSLSSVQAEVQAKQAESASVTSDDPITRYIRPTPYFFAGGHIGYRVYPGEDSSVFEALGLRPGDLVVKIDGQSIRGQEIMAAAGDRLRNGRPVTFTVNRSESGLQDFIVSFTSEQLDVGN